MPKKGRKGTDQRVKGNVKSASSGRMVELMGGDLGAGVIGFDTVSAGLHKHGASGNSDGFSVSVGAAEGFKGVGGSLGGGGDGEVSRGSGTNFQVVMKQLGKKDTTTKLKALQEFTNLCSDESPETVKANLNVWVLMYNKLSMDNDNRVREAAHKALKACAMVVKNGLAPHIRSIIGCWVSGIEDPYRPSAAAALAAFNAAFSQSKKTEVLEYSFKSIVTRTGEIVLKETPDTFSDPKIVPEDERIQRYERAVVMAVKSITYIFLKLSDDFLDKYLNVYEQLFSDKKFWKLTKHKNPGIRAATYGLITTLCEQLPFFIIERAKLFCTTSLGSLSESDPVVVGPLWEAALMVIGRIRSWNEQVNVQKAILPGLWSVMEAGGYGCAKVIYPCFLPLLNQLVEKVYKQDSKFAKSFLLHLRQGLHADRVRTSRVECDSVIHAYAECFLFMTTALNLNPAEQRSWFDEAAAMLMELLEYSLTSCPAIQSEPIMAAVVWVVSGVIQTTKKHESVDPLCSDLQLRIADKCSHILDQEEDGSKVNGYFQRIETLVKYFHTPPGISRGDQKKFVNFVVATGGKMDPLSSSFSSKSTLGSLDERTLQVRNFIKPSMCTLCSNCVAAVSRCQDNNYSHLLLTLVRLFKDQDFVKSMFSSLDSNHHRVIVRQKGHHPLRQKLLVLCSVLTKAARLKSLCPESATFTENVLESLVELLDGNLVDSSSAVMLLSEIVKDCPPVMPLILVKLLDRNRPQEFQLLLDGCKSFMEQLLSDMSPQNTIFLWSFLDVLFTRQLTSLSSCEKLKGQAFRSICQLLTDSFILPPKERNLSESSLKKLLSTLCKVPHTVIQNDLGDEASNLLCCLLHWCLHNIHQTDGDETYLSGVIESYSHLLRCLPDLKRYLQSTSHLVLTETRNRGSLLHMLYASMFCLLLHRSVLTTPETFWHLYEPLLSTAAASVENSLLPLPGLESFCKWKILFSPFFTDLSSSVVSSSLPPSLLLSLFPMIPFADLNVIEASLKATVGQSNAGDSTLPLSSTAAKDVVKAVRASMTTGPDIVRTACGCDGGEESESSHRNDQSPVMKNWKMLTTSLCLAYSSLLECQLTSRTPLEVQIRSLLLSAIEKCLVMTFESHTTWLDILVKYLIERASSDGPVWFLVIHQIFSTINKLVKEDIREEVVQRLVRLTLEEPESGILYSALSGLDPNTSWPHLETMVENINDPCLTLSFIHLFPHKEDLLTKGAKMLVELASKQSSSEITLFENLGESSQDPFTYCVLGLIRALVKKRLVPVDAWEFILCGIVSLIQLITDKEEDSFNINQTVLFSHIFSLTHSVALFFNSPFPQTHQATEWAEFFQPALQDCLLPYFMKRAELIQREISNPCLTYQHHSLCQAVSVLCSNPQNASFEELMTIVVSQFYPQQVASFILAKRLLTKTAIYIVDPPSPLPSNKIPMKLAALQEILGKSLEGINMDLVFLEDSDHSDLPEATSASEHHLLYHNTTSYVFTWLLIIEAMSQCDPEARGMMSEWMKELSLFDHLLHGLLKFITESSKGPTELKVTLKPDLEQLVCSAFMEIARHLPSMLRQWYLSVDRQTSAIVNKFTTNHISPVLHQIELQSFGKSLTVRGNMEIRVYSGVSEISVVYKVDEFSIELFVHLPSSYPLQPPGIREGKRIRIDPAQWRKWLLQFNIFVTNQNGSLMDGILLWKSNLDKHFAGVDDCMICFSVIHNSNYSLPKMVCRTCKKKFHSACLYKWFNTSNKSSCPLCRNIF